MMQPLAPSAPRRRSACLGHPSSGRISPLALLFLAGTIALAAAVALVASLHPSAPPPESTAAAKATPHISWQVLGSQGSAPGQFQQPRGIAALRDGSFIVVDREARVQHFSAAGVPLSLWSMKDHKLGNPKGLCELPNGNLLVCDTHYGRVLEMTVAGGIVKQWGSPGTGPAEFAHPLSCCVDAKRGRAYVIEYHSFNDRVQIFDLEGKFLSAFGTFGIAPGQFSRPSGITLDKEGNIYVADACNHRVQKFNPDGALLKVFGKMGTAEGELRYPYDIACGEEPSGKGERSPVLYVAEYNNMRISVFDLDGKFLRLIGHGGNGKEEFASPWSLAVDAKGRLLVSDTGNHRLQIFDFSEVRSAK